MGTLTISTNGTHALSWECASAEDIDSLVTSFEQYVLHEELLPGGKRISSEELAKAIVIIFAMYSSNMALSIDDNIVYALGATSFDFDVIALGVFDGDPVIARQCFVYHALEQPIRNPEHGPCKVREMLLRPGVRMIEVDFSMLRNADGEAALETTVEVRVWRQ